MIHFLACFSCKKSQMIKKSTKVNTKTVWNKTVKESKKVVKKKPKAKTRSWEVKNLDSRFSRYIRILYANKEWMVQCVTSWQWLHWTKIQNWHFVSRSVYKYRRSEMNCHPQCYADNVMKKWNYIEYTFFMINKYWKDYVEFMKNDKELVKITTQEIREQAEHYKKLVTEHHLWIEYKAW